MNYPQSQRLSDAEKQALLRNVSVKLSGGKLSVVYYEDESEFDGNDFEYRYSLDADSTAAFLKAVPDHCADAAANVAEWLIENAYYGGLGGDLLQAWIRMGLHGNHAVWEDYPGGIDRKDAF